MATTRNPGREGGGGGGGINYKKSFAASHVPSGGRTTLVLSSYDHEGMQRAPGLPNCLTGFDIVVACPFISIDCIALAGIGWHSKSW